MRISNMNVPGTGTSFITEFPNKISDKLYCRDPFILLAGEDYFLYRTARERGVEALVSRDLENWSDPIPVYKTATDHPGSTHFFWAPEVHYYKGMFYLITSVHHEALGRHTISVYRSASPLGPFEDIAGYCISPKNWDCIDGTLYIDSEGTPWMIFVHEWISTPDKIGLMAVAKLSDDLSHFVSEPVDIFRADDPVWTDNGVTDAPFMAVLDSGRLIMTWSNFLPGSMGGGYTVDLAYSESGSVTGPWKHADMPIYCRGLKPDFIYEGGHGMLFYDKEGRLRITFHAPNASKEVYEHVQIRYVKETADGIEIE
ncbi:MAG: family 43 glycosylhydrolase [Clostridia bacterium]|nr:family 43 glycosylhydrolase [Clostridia bacterium]